MTSSSSSSSSPTHRVAIIGGGITGACAAKALASSASSGIDIQVDLFDQGRSGAGGRSSTRITPYEDTDDTNNADDTHEFMKWDHGCQFFRADTPKFQSVVNDWMKQGMACEWKGTFASDDPGMGGYDFFGLPSCPPFYIGTDGMQSIPKKLLEEETKKHTLSVFEGTRVARMERNEALGKWQLFGTSGTAAFHDTPEETAHQLKDNEVSLGGVGVGNNSKEEEARYYDAVLLTDVSSSFGSWHRASAGVPEAFAKRVRERVGARVPLFTAMVAFDTPLPVDLDAATFHHHPTLWFAARMGSKIRHSTPSSSSSEAESSYRECWTLVSTPEYAMAKIAETPMQDAETGAFIPQHEDYLTTVPGPDLEHAFREALTVAAKNGKHSSNIPVIDPSKMPLTVYLNAQRWGSAMPCHRHLDETSPTRQVLSGVPYDSSRAPLAPTRFEDHHNDVVGFESQAHFIADPESMLFQAGDMMARYTPGFEGAALSGMEAAEHIKQLLAGQNKQE
eukprot:scaffold224238_cov55-Attheya_sp.AAC.1